jgi:putative heme iron utilization protein
VDEVFPSAPDMAELEAGAIAHMNEDHADAVRRYATRLLGAVDGDWKIAAVDPDGAEIVKDEVDEDILHSKVFKTNQNRR